ncbi:hypothetical protein [Pseudomonas sp. P8_250]|uniref:hypothetical protein n=1 Tax=Pseudomonas sp. P8_250 TaxID=3043446 RepID=UPI002A36A8A8|nr:hypothetical protein [Pseudomonas sp. P8_250]MDX9668719.1 hypothetical protein [Pseudomonas sp. P8_250]
MPYELKVEGFKKAVPKADVISVHAFYGYGDTKAFIAESHNMSVKKVSAILSTTLPDGWQAEAVAASRSWN